MGIKKIMLIINPCAGRKSGMKNAAADYINTVNDMKSVRGSNWVNVDIHNPDYMDTFYDRYRAFGSSTFDKLGFSPFRNNHGIIMFAQ